jgi:hypothetical protein
VLNTRLIAGQRPLVWRNDTGIVRDEDGEFIRRELAFAEK